MSLDALTLARRPELSVTERFAAFVLTFRPAVILAVLALVVAAGAGLGKLAFKNDYRMFFSSDNAELAAFERLQKTFNRNDNVLISVSARDGTLFTRERLQALAELSARAWHIPAARRVDSLATFQHSYAVGDEIVVEGLASRAAKFGDSDVARVREVALTDPLVVRRLVNPQGSVAGINVIVEMDDATKDAQVLEIAGQARALAREAAARYPDLQFHVTGAVMLDAAFHDASEQDMKRLTPAMLVLALALLWFFLGSFAASMATLLVIALSIVVALGLAGHLGIALSPSSLAAPTVLLTMAVADSVHFLSAYSIEHERSNDRIAAMRASLAENLPAVFFTSLATSVSFLSMNFSDAPPFRDLGNITAIGVAAAFVLSITLLPAIVTYLPAAPRPPQFRWLQRRLGGLYRLVLARPRALAAGCALVCAGLTALAAHNQLNDEYIKYFDTSVEFRRDTDYVNRNLTGVYYLEFPLGAGLEGGVSDPAYLARVDGFADWLRAQPEVLHVFSIVDVFKKLNRNMHGDDPRHFRVPDTRALAAQFLLTYELALPQGLDLSDRVSVDKSTARLTATLSNLSSQQVIELEARAYRWLQDNAPPPMQVRASGPTIMFAHIGQRNIRDMISGEILSMIVIALILVVALRSLRLGLLSLVPVLLPVGVTFGLWQIFVGQIGLASAVVAAMTLGILTDDTVHFLKHYADARRSGATTRRAILTSFRQCGPALWITSLVLVAGFGVLATSSFAINADLGLLSVIILGVGLLADFVLLPAVLILFGGKK